MTSGDMEFLSSNSSSQQPNNNNNNKARQSQDLSSAMPQVFKFQFMPSDLEAVLSEILAETTVATAFEALSQHVGDHIEPIGWKAVWQPSDSTAAKLHLKNLPPDASFRLNVLNVIYQRLEASVTVSELLDPPAESLTAAEKATLAKLFAGQRQLAPRPFNVPLIELYVISERPEDDEYHNTAYLIELVRFFSRHVWRPWDNLEEEGDCSVAGDNFVATRLIPRLKMFWEMKNGLISNGFIRRVHAILAEGTLLREKLDAITERLEDSVLKLEEEEEEEEKEDGEEELAAIPEEQMDSPAVDEGVSEIDACAFTVLKSKLLDLEREIAIIEDCMTRSLYHLLLPHKANLIQEDDDEEEEVVTQEMATSPNVKQIHLVLKQPTLNTTAKFLANLSKSLGEDNAHLSRPLKFHESLGKAITAASDGDTIFLAAGVYSTPLPWLDKSLEIVAVTEGEEEVIIRSHADSGDVLLYVDLPKGGTLQLTDLTLRAAHPLNHLIVANAGALVLSRCRLDCNDNLVNAGKAVLVVGNGQQHASLKWDVQTKVLGGHF